MIIEAKFPARQEIFVFLREEETLGLVLWSWPYNFDKLYSCVAKTADKKHSENL